MRKIIALKFLFLFLIIIGLQYGYYNVVGKYFPSIKKTSRMDYLFKKDIQDPFDIALIASSINFTTASTDNDKRDIAQMLEDKIGCQVLDVSRGGNNIELYDEITKSIQGEVAHNPKLIYEISIRTFGQVYNEPANSRSLKDDEVIFKDNLMTCFYHALNVFRYDFGLMSQKEFDHLDVFRGDKYLTTLDKFMKEDYAAELSLPQKKFLINYMSRIRKNNSKLKALEKLCKEGQNFENEILFLIPPENYQQGIEHFPDDFEKEFDVNINLVKDMLDTYEIPYLDLSKSLDSKYFTHTPEFPNGHLNQNGRRFVANRIARVITCNN